MHEYTRCLAAQLRPHGVYANVIAPGEIITPRFEASRPTRDERKVETGALTRYGWPHEVARAVEFFVTSDSSYVTGAGAEGGRRYAALARLIERDKSISLPGVSLPSPWPPAAK